ncbi:MAG: class I SAM-dependent methyltransferase [Lactobacillales bacterium]|jgi:SAM-dependent methyltransferase|nr:class I SAM-dependent methyltransferase [Lactobacillales bacterium]
MDISTISVHYNGKQTSVHYCEAVDGVGLWKSEEMIFQKYARKSDTILDMGCGAGRTTINLHRLGYTDIVGLDITSSLIDYAAKYSKKHALDIKFILGDARKTPFEDAFFDIVFFSFNGLMCIPTQANRDKVINEAYRILKPGGKFIFTAHERIITGEHALFWGEEKAKFENGTQDPRIEKFGDRLVDMLPGEEGFIHIASIAEIKEFIGHTKFKILEYMRRSDMVEENDKVEAFSKDTVFWVVQK